MIIRHARAVAAVIDHASYLSDHAGSTVSDRFLIAIERTLKRLEKLPRLGRTWNDDQLPGMRVFRLRGFPNYLLFYLPLHNGIEFVYLFHASQDIAARLSTEDDGW